MPLAQVLEDITKRLRSGEFPNERAISQGVVLRVLGDPDIGWPTWETKVVWPEYRTRDGQFVDFALCHPPTKPKMFIEVKPPGAAENGVDQALMYAFQDGAPFVLLTDGRTWSFYLPAEQGTYEDRRVYKVDLYERTPEEAADALRRYLERTALESDEALEVARKAYRNRSRRAQARDVIPETWRELVEAGDEQIVEILSSAVESKAGVRPDTDDVTEFLAELGRSPTRPSATSRATSIRPNPRKREPAPMIKKGTRDGHLNLAGKTFRYKTAKEGMVIVFRKLAERDPSFLQRCSEHRDSQGRVRKYLAHSPEELYPERADFRDQHEDLPGGWVIATHLSNRRKCRLIKMAAEVAGLSYGKSLTVDFCS